MTKLHIVAIITTGVVLTLEEKISCFRDKAIFARKRNSHLNFNLDFSFTLLQYCMS